MEHKDMLAALGSSQPRVAPGNRNVDRFSDLPDDVAHRILSNLKFRTLIRLGAVSKRCRQLYLSAPSFRLFDDCAGNKQEQLGLLNSIDRFLLLRGYNKMQHVIFHWGFCSGISYEIYRMITWIYIAVRCNVEELVFEVRRGYAPETIELPLCTVRSKSLRSLVFDFPGSLQLPTYASFTGLQILELRNVRVNESFCQWMSSSSCKCIKDLRLDRVSADNNDITIQSSSLESFSYVVHANSGLSNLSIYGEKLTHIHIEWGFYKPQSRSLNISAPNLKTLEWCGRVLNHQELGELVFLEKAKILLEHKEVYKFDNVSEILGSISRTKALTLLEDTVKILLSERYLPPRWNDVSFLTLHIGCFSDDVVPAMVSLLSGMANLNTLHISTHPSFLPDKPKACGFDKKYWESQGLAFIDQLKEVKIELCHGSNGTEFVFYILEHAQNLQKMVIYCLTNQSLVQQMVNRCKLVSASTIIFEKKKGEAKCGFDACRYHTAFRYEHRLL